MVLLWSLVYEIVLKQNDLKLFTYDVYQYASFKMDT